MCFGEVGEDIVQDEKKGDCVGSEQIRDEGVGFRHFVYRCFCSGGFMYVVKCRCHRDGKIP